MPELVVTSEGSPTTNAKAEKVKAFIEGAMSRWRMANDAESGLRERMLKDKRFYAGDQWDEAVKRDRQQTKRPCLTVNKLKHPVRLVTNQARTTKPRIQINPVDSGSDPDTAEVLQGIIRNIETQSDAAVAYQTALEDAAICGRGWLRVLPTYSEAVGNEPQDESAFQQEIRIKRIRNCFSVYPDPTVVEADYSDMNFLFQTQDLPRDEYERLYPKSAIASLSIMTGQGDGLPGWATKESVRIAEYFYIEKEAVTICLVDVPDTDGKPPTRLVMEKPAKGFAPGVTIVGEREIERRRLKWAKINAVEVLEGDDDLTCGRDMAGQWIPHIPVLGEELDIDGQVDLLGVVRDAQDSARLYNVQVTSLAEMIGLQPKAPFIGWEGQFKSKKWENANSHNYPYIETTPVYGQGGQLLPPPARQQFEAPIQAIVVSIQQADNDIKSQTMFQDASLGERGPQESGKAILARQRQGELGSSHYMDNLGRAIRHTGRIVVNLIPQIYATPRVMRILGADDTERSVAIHSQAAPGDLAPFELQKRQQKIAGIYDIGVGRFDVTVSIGPSSETQRAEGSEMMIAAMQANPQLFGLIGDLAFGMMDFPGARQVSERLKKMLPPQLQDQQGGAADPQQLQAQIQQMQQAMQQMQQQGQQMKQALDGKQAEAQATLEAKKAEIESRERIALAGSQINLQIAQLQANTDLVKAQAELKGEHSLEILKAEIGELSKRLDFQREVAVLGTEHARADQQSAQDRADAKAAAEQPDPAS